MKKLFLLLALILIFSVSGCENSIRSKPAAQNDADETAETADNDDNNNNDDDDALFFPDFDFLENSDRNPCEAEPCFGILHAAKCKPKNSVEYECICENGWFWNGEDCLSPCDSEPCDKIPHSTGGCFGATPDIYICECENNYFWNEEKCVNPCDKVPCGEIANSTGECVPQDTEKYFCRCKEGYFWNGEKCAELPECSKTSGTPCKDSATGLTWSSLHYKEVENASCGEEGGIDDWKFPSIGEVRSLIVGCPGTMPGGSCGIDDQCVTNDCYTEGCQSCNTKYGGVYSKLGDTHSLAGSGGVSYGFFDTLTWEVVFTSASISRIQYQDPRLSTYIYFRCARCDKGLFWYKDKCVKNPCSNKPCKSVAHADSEWCSPKTETTYDCACNEQDYYWDGSKCFLTPCADDPCKNIPNADPEWCNHEEKNGKMAFICRCDKNYVWNGSACVLSKCADEPCKDVVHSYGSCTPLSEDKYYCSCETSYEWGGESYDWDGEQCVSPCDSKPCEIPGSNGICDVQDAETYVCGCKSSYYWDSVSKQCLNLCDDDPCGKDENSTGTCSSKSGPDYSCECNENYVWSAALKKCVACSEEMCNFPLSDGTCPYKSSSYECGCVEGYLWDWRSKKCVIPCDYGYFLDQTGEKCVDPCEPNPCNIPYSTGSCGALGASGYTCFCNDGFIWNGVSRGCEPLSKYATGG